MECRARLFERFDCEYSKLFGENCQETFRDAIRFLLQKNILCGDALTLKTNAGEPIVFSEWAIVSDTQVKRRDFAFDEILAGHNKQTSLACFAEKAKYDRESQAFIPAPVAEFPLTDFAGVVTYE
ncbi:MAG: hypothetical protein O0X57_05155 [Methanocorpusculum sp.]|nr:hypothetical protein [Methanocorpusculum sp.]MDE2534450.1 hypothetical protein [Methanocorpusculum sp.]